MHIGCAIKQKKWAARRTNAPAYAGSRKGSHHLVFCTQPYPINYIKGCFQGLMKDSVSNKHSKILISLILLKIQGLDKFVLVAITDKCLSKQNMSSRMI